MNTFFGNKSPFPRPLKRFLRLLALFTVLLITCSIVVGCKKQNAVDYYAFVSENRSNILLAEEDGFFLRVYAVEKEYPYLADGVKRETTTRTEIYLTAPSGDKICNISFDIDGKSYGGEMSFDNVKTQYYFSCSVDATTLQSLECNLRFGETEKRLIAKTVKTENTLSPKQILQNLQKTENALFSSLTDEYGFAGEIYIRLIFEETPYYYVGVIDRNGNITAFLLSAETGKILAKRQP